MAMEFQSLFSWMPAGNWTKTLAADDIIHVFQSLFSWMPAGNPALTSRAAE